MKKLTKKQSEIINHVRRLESEHDCIIYFKYNISSKKVHPIKIIRLEGNQFQYTQFHAVCSERVAETMVCKDILKVGLIINDDNWLYKLA